ncbi:MAG: DNA primase [Chitinophagaceae bacterium]|nr:DNA primase [Chitinophagaceae bacterium]
MISPNSIEQIKSRIDIIDVIGEYVKLKKRGANYLGNCPFHNEKTPSFTVSPTKEIYKCFGCGKSGNTITFLMEHDKLSYVESLKWLAKRYNLEIEETEQSPEQQYVQQTSDSLYIINNFAQQFFQKKLWESEEGETIALSYLKDRGFNNEILNKFQVGYNPSSKNELSQALISNQFNKDLFPKTGLSILRNEEDWQDNYRGRIIFPIHQNTGKIIGFGARIIGKNDKAPKYINTPENEIYVKSKVLYGAYFAKHSIDKNDECLLVEGYTDVISLHQAGIENVVASGGTSLTTDQLRLIKKYSNNLTIIYDGDAAGIKAALRGLDMALEESLNVKLVLIPDGEDPDSFVRKIGAAAFEKFITENKKDFIIFQLQVMMDGVGNDIAKKNEVVNQIAESLSKINKVEDFIKQQEYIKQCSAILQIDEIGLINLVNKFKRDKISKDEKIIPFNEANAILQQSSNSSNTKQTEINLFEIDDLHEKNLLKILLEYGLKPWNEELTIAEHIFEELVNFEFENKQLEKIFEMYKSQFQNKEEPDTKKFIYNEDKQIADLVVSITMTPYELSNNWDNVLEGMNILNRDTSIQDVAMSLNYFKLKKIKKMFLQNQSDIEKATSFEEQKQLIEVHKNLKQIEIEITKQLGTVILK